MAIETAADLAGFFDTDDFAIVGTVRPPNRIPYEVSGIFDKAYHSGLSDTGLEVEGVAVSFLCASADLDDAKENDFMIIAGNEYRIRSVQPGANDTTRLILEDNPE